MFPALLTTVFFSISAACASKSTRMLGSIEANFWRILLATMFLGLWAHTGGGGLSGHSLGLFLISGFIGFGVGDLALYQTYPRIGSRLAMLLVHCLAAPFGAFIDWLWLGTNLSGPQLAFITLILSGVGIALAPGEHLQISRRSFVIGVLCGITAGLGQGGSAVISRKAYMFAAASGEHIDGITAAYQRIWGGLGIALGSFIIWRLRIGRRTPESTSTYHTNIRRAWKWVIVNSLAGPAIGVSCYQWALATAPTGIVLAIVALTPLVIIPFAQITEGEKPSMRSLVGGLIAVAGVIGLRLHS
jgi:drug/metabolite transporter (DMT)-like permease